ncbi:unnamed protein product [Spirodela intermedia]|uniref:Uncharacterized protein n=1 Tax=Spirodela intermedia TaxID=51605 RepID=A0A811G6J0_SPIIN|nr:unnamed protein product [Spirodela intermedia]
MEAILGLSSSSSVCSSSSSSLPPSAPPLFVGRGTHLEWLPVRRSVAEVAAALAPVSPPLSNSSFVLAEERTRRKDPLDGYDYYTGGWNISNHHYWASVGLTAVPLFLIGGIWFVGFGLSLLLICCFYCCCSRRSYSYSRIAYALSLILLILFTCAAIAGCIILYTGQGKLHVTTSNTLDYVADFTVENLKNFSENLSAAKRVSVGQSFLPADVQRKIDTIEAKLNSSSNELASRTKDNSEKIRDVLDTVRLCLIVIAAVMLALTFLGFLLSILGLQCPVYTLVIIGWILVAGTFILSGVFLLFHNVIGDTCVAMDDWVQHPHARTALDDILPCVDAATANESLYQSKEVTLQLANVVNQYIANISNRNFPPGIPLYYNQSGPVVPLLCNPFNPDLSERQCLSGEVGFGNASQVWRRYVCEVSARSGGEVCTTTGRLTQRVYSQIVAATSVSAGCYQYGPFLADLQGCTFVRNTFSMITHDNCPGLRRDSNWVYVGLAVVSGAVMLSLLFWVIYTWERRHRKNSKKQFITGS